MCEGKCEGKTFTLTLALTTETPINRAFQAECEGVRAKKEKSFFSFLPSFFILHSTCCLALCKPAATELKIKKRSRIITLNCIIGFSSGRRTLFLNRRSRQFFIGFPSGRRTSFLHSSFYQQPQAVTLANPFIIPLHRKTKVK